MIKDKNKQKEFLFAKNNYIWMLIGVLFVVLGFVLMSGGGSKDPAVFSEAIYNFRRIRLAPTLVLIGFVIEVYAILASPKQ
ncbi:MAG: DUF3098 domain-containing protein [Flavicella sp.]